MRLFEQLESGPARWVGYLLGGVAAILLVASVVEIDSLVWLDPGEYVSFAVVAALLFHARRLARLESLLARIHPGWLALGLTVLALLYRTGFFVLYAADFTFDGYMVHGAPFSDAAAWHAMSRDFAAGDRLDSYWVGWSARRPLYYLFMGSVFSITRSSVPVAQWTQFFLSALSVVLLFDAIRRAGPLLIAVTVPALYAVDAWDASLNLSTMTESIGSCGTIVSLWMTVVAVDRAARRPAKAEERSASLQLVGIWALSGATLALANLARSLTLPVAATLGLVPFVLCWHHRPRCTWSTPALWVGVYLLAVAITLAPWVIRNQLKHGIASLSENSGEMLFAATSPDHGSWSPDVARLGDAHTQSTGERVAFFNRGIRDNLRENPGFYVSNSVHFVRTNLRALALRRRTVGNLLVFTCAVVLACLARGGLRVRYRVAIAALVALLLLNVAGDGWAQAALLLIAIPLGAARRPVLLLLAVFCITLFLVLGMVAVPAAGVNRFNYSLRWIYLATVWWSAWELFTAAAWVPAASHPAGRTWLQSPPNRRPWGRAALPLGMVSVAAVVLLLTGTTMATIRRLTQPAAEVKSTRLIADPAGHRKAFLGHASYSAWAPWRHELEFYRTRLDPGFFYRFDAGERINHWYIGFSSRDYPYITMRITGAWLEYVQYPGHEIDARLLRPGQDVIMIGLFVPPDPSSGQPTDSNSPTEIFEVLALGLPGEPIEILPPETETLRAHEKHLMTRLRRAAVPQDERPEAP